MVTFVPNMRRAAPTNAQAFVDTPNFIYSNWLAASGGIDGPIGKVDKFVSPNPNIAVIGGGVAGFAAAFELQKCGAMVTLFDAETTEELADNRQPGGRLYSSQFRDVNGVPTKDIAELGAMRFPPSEEALSYYLAEFEIPLTSEFPDPGQVPTWIYYQGNGQIWNGQAPNGFERVGRGWADLVANGISDNSGKLAFWSAKNFNRTLQQSPSNGVALNSVTGAWQAYINEFENDSFYSGLTKIFGPQPKWRVPNNAVWTAEDFTRFGALGLGSGGFGPLYNIGFIYIYQLLTNALETEQQFVPGGISQLCTCFRDRFVGIGGHYRNQTRVKMVQVARPDAVSVTLEDGSIETFSRAIVATTTRAMEMGLNLSDAQPKLKTNMQTTHVQVGEAINRTHVIPSTKLFLRTKKFWNGTSNYPRVILSDTKCPQVYTLDYGDPESGVVLITYTWEDDSIKTQALSAEELLEVVKAEITTITKGTKFDDYAEQLKPFSGDLKRDMRFIVWQSTKDYFGAFTLARPGQDHYVESMFYDFQKAGTADDNLIYIAGDCTSWTGGWAEGALHTGLNCAAAVIQSLGGTLFVADNPMTKIKPGRYNYFPGPLVTSPGI